MENSVSLLSAVLSNVYVFVATAAEVEMRKANVHATSADSDHKVARYANLTLIQPYLEPFRV